MMWSCLQTPLISNEGSDVTRVVKCKHKQTHLIIILLLHYRDLLSEFQLNLKDLNKEKPLALLVDGADRVHDGRGQRVSEWIPQHIPKVREGNMHT